MLSEKGSLRDTPAIKLMLTVFEQGLTGILYIKREDILKVLYFSRGKLIWAISNSDVDKLENILAAKDLVDPETIKQVKKEARVSDSIGKLLVEKGLITLEELIESSKEQLKRIILSVLKWKEGGFQFVKDAPPERLLSLDLDITQFVVDYIVENVDLSEIWKEIGSLQVEFLKNPDEQKQSKYHLSDKQKELLNSFDGEKKLEAILSRHSTGHRESILKIIYFFIMAELVIKKEFELSDLSVFEERDFDFLESGQPKDKPIKSTRKIPDVERFEPEEPALPPEPVPGPVDIVDTGTVPGDYEEPMEPAPPRESPGNITAHDHSYVFAQEEENEAQRTYDDELPEPPLAPIKREQPDIPAFLREEKPNEKKRLKLFNIMLILLFLILVLSGVIFLLFPWLENTEPRRDMVKDSEKIGVKDIVTFQEKTNAREGGTDSAAPGETTGAADQPTVDKPPPDKQTEEKQSTEKPGETLTPTSETKPGETKTTAAEKKPDSLPAEKPQTLQPGKSAKAYFNEGSFITAGDVWKSELAKAGINYSILLEMDCLKESVMHTYNRIEARDDFFILNRKVGNKTCFLVFWGKFETYDKATEGIKAIPAYFWKLKDPPEIVEISKYF